MRVVYVLALFAVACAHPNPTGQTVVVGPDLALEWNQRILEVAEAEDKFLTLKGVRTATMMHLAMHDALNAINPRYDTYLDPMPRVDADPVVAATTAAYEVALAAFPDQEDVWQALRDRSIDPSVASAAMERAVALGRAAAAAIVRSRAGDGWDSEAEYTWHPMGPGVYAEFSEHSGTPEGFVFGAGWADAQPFGLESASYFRAPPPPDVASATYAEAFAEVKNVGRAESGERTADQTHLAMWWKDFVENSHNRLARDLAAKDNLDLWATTRLLALLNLSVFDAYINVFENKFYYNHWRPFTAIRWAEHDGNSQTQPELDWTNTHGHTYAFPSYPSAHGCASTAAMHVMADTFGRDRSFVMRTEQVDLAGPFSGKIPMDPPTRSFESFADAGLEASMSRLYLGIHFRYDSVEGNLLGERIGSYLVESHLNRR